MESLAKTLTEQMQKQSEQMKQQQEQMQQQEHRLIQSIKDQSETINSTLDGMF